VAFGVAGLFGVSFELGAFFAGMMMGESKLAHDAAEETLPLRDAFAVLFFVSIGMLFNYQVLLTEPLLVLAAVGIILIGKSLAALGIVLAFKRPLRTALTIAASLAQIGEFSFILIGVGVAQGLVSKEAQDILLAAAIVSILLNPLLFILLDRAKPWLDAYEAAKLGVDATEAITLICVSAGAHCWSWKRRKNVPMSCVGWVSIRFPVMPPRTMCWLAPSLPRRARYW